MPDFVVDLTPQHLGAVVIQEPSDEGGTVTHRYHILPLNKQRLELVTRLAKEAGAEEADPAASAAVLHETLGGLLEPANGEGPADELLTRLWESGTMPIHHLQNLAAHVAEQAATGPPA